MLLYDTDLLPSSHAKDLEVLRGWLADAAKRTRAERAGLLGLASLAATPGALQESIASRTSDWAQVRPEWGLAGCAAFIVAPRSRSRHINAEMLRLNQLARGEAAPNLAVVRANWQLFVSPTAWSWVRERKRSPTRSASSIPRSSAPSIPIWSCRPSRPR
jgi:hypothetical protein